MYSDLPFCPPEVTTPYPEPWIPLKSLERMSNTEYDVLVVGTGAGGGAAIWRMCEHWAGTGKRIGVVDAGGLILPTHLNNVPTIGSERRVSYRLSYKFPIGQLLPEFPGVRQVYGLGGRTLFWGSVSPRMHQSEFSDWPLSYEELSPFYNIAEQIMSVGTDFTADSTFQKILLQRLQKNGYPNAAPSPLAIYTKASRFGQVFSTPFFSSIDFLAYGMNRHPFDLAVYARCVNVLTEKGRASGVRVITPDFKSYVIRAKNVVLAASTIETPRILLSSGIPGAAIGHYLMDHSLINASAKFSRKQFPEIAGNAHILTPSSNIQPYQIQLLGGSDDIFWYQQYQYIPFKEDLTVRFQGLGEVLPRFENQLFLDPVLKDNYGIPCIKIRFSYHLQDYAIINRMASDFKEMAAAMGTSLLSEPGKPDICLVPPGTSYHEAGTCRMGDDPATSVTNRYGGVHGISGLYIADNSVLRSMGGTNPTLTTIALAIRTADYIAGG